MMPTVLSNMDKTAGSFRTGMGLTFDELGIVHKCYTHRHAVGPAGGRLRLNRISLSWSVPIEAV